MIEEDMVRVKAMNRLMEIPGKGETSMIDSMHYVITRTVYRYPLNDATRILIQLNRYDMYRDTYRLDSFK